MNRSFVARVPSTFRPTEDLYGADDTPRQILRSINDGDRPTHL